MIRIGLNNVNDSEMEWYLRKSAVSGLAWIWRDCIDSVVRDLAWMYRMCFCCRADLV
jgi:hypothetical protein